jgi:hypothetical protein
MFLDYYCGHNLITWVPLSRDHFLTLISKRDVMMEAVLVRCYLAGFEDGRQVTSQGMRWHVEAGRIKEVESSPELPERNEA